MDVAAPVGLADTLKQPFRIAVDNDVVRGGWRTVRCKHEDIKVRPGPPVGADGGLERRAAHQDRIAARLELREAVALAGDKGRVGELSRPTVRRGDVAIGTHAHPGTNLHQLAPLSYRVTGGGLPSVMTAADRASHLAAVPETKSWGSRGRLPHVSRLRGRAPALAPALRRRQASFGERCAPGARPLRPRARNRRRS